MWWLCQISAAAESCLVSCCGKGFAYYFSLVCQSTLFLPLPLLFLVWVFLLHLHAARGPSERVLMFLCVGIFWLSLCVDNFSQQRHFLGIYLTDCRWLAITSLSQTPLTFTQIYGCTTIQVFWSLKLLLHKNKAVQVEYGSLLCGDRRNPI